MAKCKKFKAPEGLPLNYDNIYVIPTNSDEYMAFHGDTIYTFKDSEAEEICEKISSFGCTSYRLSKEDLLAIIEKLKEYS